MIIAFCFPLLWAGGRSSADRQNILRRRLLEALWAAPRPLSAYELLPLLGELLGRKLTPATVYRALDFLHKQGLVARIESRNAFVPCAHPDHPHTCVFFVCDRCGASVEIEDPALERRLVRDASSLGFEIGRKVIELRGACAQCRAVKRAVLPTDDRAAISG